MTKKILSDIEIAQSAVIEPIKEIARKLNVENEIEYYGNYKAKLNIHSLKEKEKVGKLVLVTAINPTPAGEGKTTTTIGLGDALNKIGKKTVIALREPSLGPVFGVKGGAAGGGYAQVLPMEDINLHFTGDFHAIGAANNLLAALIDNHIYQGNALNIDVRRITWKRVIDMNDRQLRYIVNGINGRTNGVPREDGFDITVASEVMAVLCLATDIEDLKNRLGRIVVGYTHSDEPVTAHQLQAEGAMAALLKDAIKPNLVQTLEGNPAFIHGGPFANIAHGCNSVIATETALKLGEYVVTEAGFGADLGAEKFLDIKCRSLNQYPNAVVIVATVNALKMNGGVAKADLKEKNVEALERGIPNLLKHIENVTKVFKLPAVVAMNKLPIDDDELALIRKYAEPLGVKVICSDVWAKGSEGGIELAEEVVRLTTTEKEVFEHVYDLSDSIEEKIKKIVTKVYGGKGVVYTAKAKKEIKKLTSLGYNELPICMAKTQYSLTDDATLLGRPEGFEITIRDIKVSAGAGFIVALTGEVMTMPGLPKVPSSNKIDIDLEGKISGLF